MHQGHELVYDTYGHGDRLVIYLHGLLVDSDMNRGIAAALAEQGNKVVLIDLLGHGRSDKPVHAFEYRIDTYSDQVFALMDHLKARQVVLGGMSLGANVSLFAASREPDRVGAFCSRCPFSNASYRPWRCSSLRSSCSSTTGVRCCGSPRACSNVRPGSPWRPPTASCTSAPFRRTAWPRRCTAFSLGRSLRPRRSACRSRFLRWCSATPDHLIHPFDDAENLAVQLHDAELVHARSPLELRLRPRRLTAEMAAFVERVWADVGVE